ncbi:hypothetical protein GPJ56_002491 [Histomonas meleagridis]|uniref:uncharacterized protein n=1 Tax=Histomonas meleagridis TaxID=135588 RepID=UPI0035595A5E|nr:hypothetical protein GPJ56_002491 [Histomonas meleagridis]KAH0806045.1 hypothetical protein GO595_001206 [Histomonas meleagridis]
MGCGFISVQPHHQRVSRDGSQNGDLTVECVDFPIKYFDEIVNHVRTIAAPPNMMPVVCFASNSFPIVASFLHMDSTTPFDIGIQLPIVAASVFSRGRVICFSQLQFLTLKYMRIGDTRKLISNCINWITNGHNAMTPVLGIGFTKEARHNITHALKEIGIFIEYGSFKVNFTGYKGILIPSDIELSPKKIDSFVEYVRNGGGLAVFYNHTEANTFTFPINNLLSRFSLSHTPCLLNEDVEVYENIQVPSSYTYVRDSNFMALLEKFNNLIQQQKVDTSALDDIVTLLRYYIMVCNENYSKELSDLTDSAWDFLIRTNYHTERGICPNVEQSIVVVLLMDLYTILPINLVKPIPEHKDFPGKTGNVVLSDFHKTFELPNDVWVSTGLWLPAGVAAVVTCKDIVKNAHIQVGSQQESLLTKPGPWRRWPSVVSVNLLTEKSTTVISTFGGIVYVAVSSDDQDFKPPTIDLTFHNFCEHPIAIYSDPSAWERTKDIEVPWGEIVAKDITFTVPKSKMHELGKFDDIYQIFDVIIQEIKNYIGYCPPKPYRIIFDIELPDDCPSCGYPLVFDISDIDNILSHFDQPTTQLFTAVTMLAVVSIREGCFDQLTETAIATLAASAVFQKLFPGFDPLEFNGICLPTLFHELWEIHTSYDPELIPKTLERFQDPDHPILEVPEDKWISFVREICRVGGINFTHLLERARPIPLNISTSLQGLPGYGHNSE